MFILGALPIVAALVSSASWAGERRCVNAQVERAMVEFEGTLPGRGRELVESGSQGFSVSGVLGVRFSAEPGFVYESYVISPERSHLLVEVFDDRLVPYSKYESPSSFTVKHGFRTNLGRSGYHTLSVGSLSGTPLRCVYYALSRKRSH